MRLKDQDGIATPDLPLARFGEHLRLGTGFGEEAIQAPILEAALRAAIAAIEARTGKVLLERTFVWQTEAWRDPNSQALPVAPVNALLWTKVVSRDGTETPVDPNSVALEASPQRPLLRATFHSLPTIPTYGYAEVGFLAGYGPVWDTLPADLAQAVLLLAAHFYEVRNDSGAAEGGMPLIVSQLIERYRTVRILGGSAA